MILGSYSRLSMQLILSRKITYHLFRTYLPSGLFVVIGWFSLYIPIEHVPGRVTMGMTTILTLAAMFSAIATTTPRVSYRCYNNNFWDIKCLVYFQCYFISTPLYPFSSISARNWTYGWCFASFLSSLLY